MAGRYVLRKSGDQFYFNLKAGNNKVILTSERHTAKASALEGIEAVKANAEHEARYEPKFSPRTVVATLAGHARVAPWTAIASSGD